MTAPSFADRAVFPIRAVVDTNVFAKTRLYMSPLERRSREGVVRLFWSPWIVSEVNRVLTWLWLRRTGGDVSDANWRACSIAAKAMFEHVTRMFEVVEDRPPYPTVWTYELLDEWDIPIFAAAKSAGAHFILTENIDDGPPADQQFGCLRVWDKVIYTRPRQFLDFLAWTLDEFATVMLPGDAPSYSSWWHPPAECEDPEWEIVLRLAIRHGTLWPKRSATVTDEDIA